jgi:hypothetical protein
VKIQKALLAALAATVLCVGSAALAGPPPPVVYYALHIQPHGQGDIHTAGTDPRGGDILDDCYARTSPCQRAFEAGTTLTLTATPVDTFTFAGWALDCASNTGNTCDLTMDQDHSVEGTFLPPDTTIPTAGITKPTFPVVGSVSIPLEWTGDDGTGSGIASYDVAVRGLKYTDHLLPRRSLVPGMQGLTTTAATFTGKPGYTYCFYARARDHAGNTSTFNNEWNCATVPVDDKTLTRSSGWTQKTNQSGFFQKTYALTTTIGKTLTLANVQADQIGVLALACPACGKIKFKFGGITWTANLKASTTRHVLFYTPMYDDDKKGSIVITSTTSGKTIEIDGVFVISIGNHIGETSTTGAAVPSYVQQHPAQYLVR